MFTQPDPSITAPVPLESPARLSLRDMFLVTALAAACLAVVAPWFREWSPERRTAFLSVWCSMTLGAASISAYRSLRRVRQRRPAGLLRFPLRQTIGDRMVSFGGVAMVLWGATYMLWILSEAVYLSRGWRGAWIWHFFAFGVGMSIDLAGLWIVWKSTSYLELRNAGIPHGIDVLPWGEIRSFRWGGSDPNLLVLQCPLSVMTFRVRAVDRPAIDEYLASRVATKSN